MPSSGILNGSLIITGGWLEFEDWPLNCSSSHVEVYAAFCGCFLLLHVDVALKLKRFINLSILTALITGLGSCTSSVPSNRSSIRISADYMSITGRLTAEDRTPVYGASVYMDATDHAIAVSDESGNFNFALSDQMLQKLQAGSRQKSIRLFAAKLDGENSLFGLSSPISIAAGLRSEIGDIRLSAPLSYSAKIVEFGGGGILTPSSGAKASAFLDRADSDEKGEIMLKNLPRAEFDLMISKSGFETRSVNIDGGSKPKIDNPIPIVLFADGSLGGVVHDLSKFTDKPAYDSSHPYRKIFRLDASLLASKIAYSSNREELADATKVEWQSVSREFAYDFEGLGERTLFYRVADKESNAGPIQTIKVQINLLSENRGLRIGDGSGIIKSRSVKVAVDPPAHAAFMRVSQSPLEFNAPDAASHLAWMEVKPEINWVFDLDDKVQNGELVTLYCQFRTAANEEGPLFYSSALLKPFENDQMSFKIEGGSPTTAERVVELAIQAPPMAVEMAVYEEIISGGGVVIAGNLVQMPNRESLDTYWMPVQPKMFFLFQSSGRKEVYVKFRSADRIESSIIKQQIQVLPFVPHPQGIAINDGAMVTGTRNLKLDLIPPARAVGFRVSESIADFDDLPYQSIVREMPFLASKTGLITVNIQFVDIDGNDSYLSQSSIIIDPFAAGNGDFTINDGSPLAVSRILLLNIQPPQGAIEMQFGRRLIGSANDPFAEAAWTQVANFAEIVVPSLGTHSIWLRFRNIDGEVSPAIQRVINYDPFPPGTIGISLMAISGTVTDRRVNLVLNAPSSAWRMRVSHLLAAFQNLNFGNNDSDEPAESLNYQPNFTYILPPRSGEYRIYAQFESFDRSLSQIISIPVTLEMFPAANMNFTINSGATTTASRLVSLQLNPPPSARGVQISEDLSNLALSPVLQLQSVVSYQMSTEYGRKTIYLRYTADSNLEYPTSAVVHRSIDYDPFVDMDQPLSLDGGATTTIDQDVDLDFDVGSDIYAFRISESMSLLNAASYSVINDGLKLHLSAGDGLKTVYVQFMTGDGVESTVYIVQIELDSSP